LQHSRWRLPHRESESSDWQGLTAGAALKDGMDERSIRLGGGFSRRPI